MSHDQSNILVNDLTRQFEGGLAELKYEYQKRLQETDPIDRDAFAEMLTLFNQRLVIFQHTFLEHLVRAYGKVDDTHTQEFEVEAPPLDRKPEIAAWIIGGLGGLGSYGAWKILPKHPAGIIGGLVVVAGASIFTREWKNNKRKSVRKQLTVHFDEEIAPSLRAWAHDKIEAAQSDEETAPPLSVLAPDKTKAQ